MASFAGLGALSVACCYLLYALYARLVLNESPAGFTALIISPACSKFSWEPNSIAAIGQMDGCKACKMGRFLEKGNAENL